MKRYILYLGIVNNYFRILKISMFGYGIFEKVYFRIQYSYLFFFSLDQHNCLLAFSGLVDDNFPWAQFCLVVEYENQSDTVWKDHCERQNIRHIALTLDKGDPQGSKVLIVILIGPFRNFFHVLEEPT